MKHATGCKCGDCRGSQSAAEALFSSHQESGFSGSDGCSNNAFKKIMGDTNEAVPAASPGKDGPNVHSEGRDAKQGAHGTISPGTQSKGGIFRG